MKVQVLPGGVWTQRSGAPSIAVAFWAVFLAVAGLAVDLWLVCCHRCAVQSFPAGHCVKFTVNRNAWKIIITSIFNPSLLLCVSQRGVRVFLFQEMRRGFGASEEPWVRGHSSLWYHQLISRYRSERPWVRSPIMVSLVWALPLLLRLWLLPLFYHTAVPEHCVEAPGSGPWVWALCVPVVGVLTADEAGLMEAASVALDLLCVVRRLLTGSALGSSAPVWHPGNGRRVPMVWWDYTLLCYPVQSIRTCLSNVRNLSNEARISHRRSEDISLCFEATRLCSLTWTFSTFYIRGEQSIED